MGYDYFDKYTFLCEMYMEKADKVLNLILNFYPYDNSVQIVYPEKGKNLLKRIQLPNITLEKLQIGNVIAICSKLLLITGCAAKTSKELFDGMESTFVLIKPTDPSYYGRIITYIEKKGFQIVNMKNGKMDKSMGVRVYEKIQANEMLPVIVDYITSGEVVGLEVRAPNAVKEFRKCLGATDPKLAAPGTLRRLYGENILRNVAHACSELSEAAAISKLYFGQTDDGQLRVPYRATLKDCTCCIIKPHSVLGGYLGQILEKISATGVFYISAMSMFTMDLTSALEFYEIYKGVLPEYEAMAQHLAEGRCVAIEIKSKHPDINVVCEFRKLCGPRDPAVCRQLYPDTIRAQYGKDLIHNAVHCTDLPEEGVLEVEYFFSLLGYYKK